MRKLIYFSGVGRSGSTVLTSILAEAPRVCSIGEFLQFGVNFERGARCECGELLGDCRFWRNIADQVDAAPAQLAKLSARLQYSTRSSRPLAVARTLAGGPPSSDDFLAEELAKLLTAAANVSSADVVVESSKAPFLIPLLARVLGFSTYVIRVVRSRRGVVASYAQSKRSSPRGRRHYYTRHNPLSVSMIWASKNLLSARIERTSRRYGMATRVVQFEDFLAAPLATIESLSDWVGHPLAPESLTDSGYYKNPQHTAGGNVNRFASGWIPFKSG
jgi:hypothetical protein